MSLTSNEAGSANFDVQKDNVNNNVSGGETGNENSTTEDFRGIAGQEGVGPGGFGQGFRDPNIFPYFHHHYPYYPYMYPYAYDPFCSPYYPYPYTYGYTVVVV